MSVSLNWNDGEVSHVKFDVDMDEVSLQPNIEAISAISTTTFFFCSDVLS